MKKRFVFCGWLAVAFHAAARPVDCDTADTTLHDMAAANRHIRQEAVALSQNPKATVAEKSDVEKRWVRIDGENLRQLKEIVAACGWPKTKEGSHDAWLLAQYADNDLPFQRRARGLLENAVGSGSAAWQDLASLTDRIAVHEGRPQEYGTQFALPDLCHVVLYPMDDRVMVNLRRRVAGLQSVEEYEAETRRQYATPDCPVTTGRQATK